MSIELHIMVIVIALLLGWLLGICTHSFYCNGSFVNLFQKRQASVPASLLTERSEIEQLEFLYKILDTTNTAVIARDTTDKVIYFNNAWRQMTGRSDAQMYDDDLVALMDVRQADGKTPLLPEQSATYLALKGKASAMRLFHHHAGQRESTPVLASGYPLYDEQGAVMGAHVTIQDISGIQHVELALERERALLNAIIKVLPDAFTFCDMSGEQRMVNDAMGTLRSVANRNNNSKNDIDIDIDTLLDVKTGRVPLPGRSPMERALKGETVVREEQFVTSDTDDSVSLLTSAIPVYDKGQKQYGAFTLSQDVTAINKISDVRSEAKRVDALHTLAAGIAHDFNNQLGVILASAQLALLRIDNRDNVLKQLDMIADVAQSGSSLTRRLMTLGNSSSGDVEYVNIKTLFAKLVPEARAVFEAYVDLSVSDIDPEWTIHCDSTQFESAILNLLLNAKEATQEADNPRVSILVDVVDNGIVESRGLSADENWLSISVEDNGVGFTPVVSDRAFNPFFTTKDGPGGMGLGLAMVDGFVRQHGGCVTIVSAQSKKTAIEMILPLVIDHSVANHRVEKVNIPYRGRGETILVVEDRPALLTVTCEMLAVLNYQTVTAVNSAEALQHIEDNPLIALVIADVMLGDGIDGFEMMEIAHRHRPNLDVIYTSGYNGGRRDNVGAPPSTYLQKPVTLDALSEALENVLKASRNLNTQTL